VAPVALLQVVISRSPRWVAPVKTAAAPVAPVAYKRRRKKATSGPAFGRPSGPSDVGSLGPRGRTTLQSGGTPSHLSDGRLP